MILPEIPVEEAPESAVPTSIGRPGRDVPQWVLRAIERSVHEGKWLTARVDDPSHGEELVEVLHYVHRSTRMHYAKYRVYVRREEHDGAVQVFFRATVEDGEIAGVPGPKRGSKPPRKKAVSHA